jgi:hypothetical protein
MKHLNELKIFNDNTVRTIWDEKQEKWFFSIIDVVYVLTESERSRKYWNDLKIKLRKEGSQVSENIGRLKAEGNETVTKCHGFKMLALDGKMRTTDFTDT